jgi:Protein of unknown function (DUF2891)
MSVRLAIVLACFASAANAADSTGPGLGADAAARFVKLALACVQVEYPNKIAHVLDSDQDVRSPRSLTPSFYGCYDWHSAVHAHWLLARAAARFPDAPFVPAASAALAAELGRPPALQPLETEAATRIADWLSRLRYPIRTGEHNQTAFSFGLIWDWAAVARRSDIQALLAAKGREYYLADRNCPLAYEPSGEDFLSPCLAEADFMRRVLTAREFSDWLTRFLPQLPRDGSTRWLPPGIVTDRKDPKLAHIDGLNLSRAWMLRGMASALPERDRRRRSLLASVAEHRALALPAVTGEHYEGGHWLGTFAFYLETDAGLR